MKRLFLCGLVAMLPACLKWTGDFPLTEPGGSLGQPCSSDSDCDGYTVCEGEACEMGCRPEDDRCPGLETCHPDSEVCVVPTSLVNTPWPLVGRDVYRSRRSHRSGPTNDTPKVLQTPTNSDWIRHAIALGPDGWAYPRDGDIVTGVQGTTVEWEYDTGSTDNYAGAIITAAGNVLLPSYQQTRVVDAATGAFVTDIPWQGHGAMMGLDGRVYFMDDNTLIAIEPGDNSVLWTFEDPAVVPASATSILTINETSLFYFFLADYNQETLGTEIVEIALSDRGELSRVRMSLTGTANLHPFDRAVVSGAGVVYFSGGYQGDRAVIAVAMSTGAELWRFNGIVGYLRDPLALGPDGTVYAGSDEYGLDADGQVMFSVGTQAIVQSPPSIDAGGRLFAGDDDGIMYEVSDG